MVFSSTKRNMAEPELGLGRGRGSAFSFFAVENLMDLLVVRYGLGVKDPTSRLCVRIPPDNLGSHTGINRSALRLGKKKEKKKALKW